MQVLILASVPIANEKPLSVWRTVKGLRPYSASQQVRLLAGLGHEQRTQASWVRDKGLRCWRQEQQVSISSCPLWSHRPAQRVPTDTSCAMSGVTGREHAEHGRVITGTERQRPALCLEETLPHLSELLTANTALKSGPIKSGHALVFWAYP